MKAVDVIVTFPEDYQAEDLAGKEAKFVTTIHEVKLKKFQLLTMSLQKTSTKKLKHSAELKEKYRKGIGCG